MSERCECCGEETDELVSCSRCGQNICDACVAEDDFNGEPLCSDCIEEDAED